MVSTNELAPPANGDSDTGIVRYASFDESLDLFEQMYSKDFSESEKKKFDVESIEELDKLEANEASSPLTPQETRLVAEVAALPAVESRTRRSRLRNWCGRLATRAYFRSMDMAAAPAAGYRKGNTALETRFAATETDGRLKRFGKALGRHALKAVAYTAGAVAGGAYLYSLGREVHSVVQSISDLSHPAAATETVMRSDVKTLANMTILVGGRGDQNGTIAQNMNANTGVLDGQVIRVTYPAGVSPLLGDAATSDQSAAVGSRQILDTIHANPGKTFNVVTYSDGTLAADLAEKDLRAQNGGNLPAGVNFVREGAPAGADTGVLNNKAIGGVAHLFGVTANTPENGTGDVNVTQRADLYGNGANLTAEGYADSAIGTLAGNSHNYAQSVVGGAPETVLHNTNGSATKILETGSGIGSALKAHGINVTKPQDDVLMALRGDSNGNYNAADIGDKLAENLDPVTGSIVKQEAPQFQPVADAVSNLTKNIFSGVAAVTNPTAAPVPSAGITTHAPIVPALTNHGTPSATHAVVNTNVNHTPPAPASPINVNAQIANLQNNPIGAVQGLISQFMPPAK